jgi:hypothetical protein
MNQIKTKHMEIMTKSANTPFLSVITYLWFQESYKIHIWAHFSGHFY